MFSKFFINRPIFASVISIVIVLAGLASMRVLPIEQYPQIVPTVVSITANYPGATSEVISQTVAAPLEQQVNGVEDMLYMQSGSASNGSMTLNVYFAIGVDPDQATINVNNRVQAAMAQLPEEVKRQGVTVRKKSTSILNVVTIGSNSNEFDTVFLSNYALLNIFDELKRIPGIGDVTMFGGSEYAMRVWLKPDRLAQLQLTTSDVVAAIREQNAQLAAGKIGAQPSLQPLNFTYTVNAKGRLATEKEFENIIVRSMPDGSKIRLKDIARVEMGGKDYDLIAKRNGKESIGMGIYLQPGANALAVTEAVRNKMEELKTRFPKGIEYTIPFDTTKFVKVSIEEVVHTLLEAITLVLIVVFLFLQNWRATLIPCIAVPISLIGTFSGMLLLGFSINLLTLFGMVLAIGIVVDDAIVVLENVERIMSAKKCSAKEAAILAMEEVAGPVIAIVLVLCAVFLPVAFMGGMTGVMYKQFAVTIAVSVVLSGIVALTLTPALCALMLKPGHHEPNAFFRWFNRGFDKLTNGYVGGVSFLNRRAGLALMMFAVLLVCIGGLLKAVPGALVPDEDQGYLFAAAILPDAASLNRTTAAQDKLYGIIGKDKAIENVVTFSGYDILSGSIISNAGISFITLADWSQRKGRGESAQELARKFMGAGFGIKDALIMTFNPPAITGMSTTGGLEAYIQNRGTGGSKELSEAMQKLIAEVKKNPNFAGANTTFRANVPQIYLDLDREKTKALGVKINDVFDTMQATFGQTYVNDFNKFGRTYRVQLQAESIYRSKVDDVRNVYVRSQNGNMIPLSSLVTVKNSVGPELVERFNIFNAAKLMAQPAPGISSGQAIKALEDLAQSTLGNDFSLAWMGSAYQEKAASGSAGMAFGFGILMVFLILAAQYERWSLPMAVITAVPFALFGALLAAFIFKMNNDVYFQIGLVTLIGLAAKNAILIVEFAVMKHEEGNNLLDSALEAARLRFRPIVMTSLAFILGCVPLVTSSGAGAASRHSLGTPVIGGMLAATFIATFFIPLFFRLIMKGSEKKQLNQQGISMRKTILALSIATLLGACAFTPDNTIPATDLPAEQAASATPALASNWWTQFNDPILNQLIEQALSNNQNLALVTARVDEARAVLGITSSAQLPQIGLGAGAGRQHFSDEAPQSSQRYINDYKLVGQASWELDIWGRVRNLTDAAKQDLLASEYNREGVKLSLAAEVAQNYFNLRALDEQLTITDHTIQSRQESYNLREKRFKGGMTSELDVRQAQAELAAAQASRPSLQISQSRTESALSVLIGQSPRALIKSGIERGLSIPQFSTPVDIAANLDSSLLLRRADIAQAEAGLLAARARIESARAAYFPRISLTGVLGLESYDLGNLFQGSAKTWSFAGNLAMPLFDGGLTASQIDQARARERQAAAIYQQAIQISFAETRSTLLANQVSVDRVNADLAQVNALQRQLKLATLRYDNGFSSYLEVLDAERSLFVSQLQLVSSQRDLLSNRVGLYKALGGGWMKN